MSAQPIPIEDDPCDVLGKAMRGLDLSLPELAQSTGLTTDQIQDQLNGEDNLELLIKIAPVLGLSATSLAGLPSYRPEVIAPVGLECFVTPFGHAGVNAFAIIRNKHAIIIDTGTDASSLLSFIENNALQIDQLLITHRHADHIACLEAFQGVDAIYPEHTAHGDIIETTCGPIKALDVSGHILPARAYLYEGLDLPVCAVGDSVFAGSMGGTKHPDHYTVALRTAQENIMTLPENTVICPGHGPLTSVGMEKKHNPFLNTV